MFVFVRFLFLLEFFLCRSSCAFVDVMTSLWLCVRCYFPAVLWLLCVETFPWCTAVLERAFNRSYFISWGRSTWCRKLRIALPSFSATLFGTACSSLETPANACRALSVNMRVCLLRVIAFGYFTSVGNRRVQKQNSNYLPRIGNWCSFRERRFFSRKCLTFIFCFSCAPYSVVCGRFPNPRESIEFKNDSKGVLR